MTGSIKKQAIRFLVLLGVISLLSDFTHEGARSIYGPFLGLIGAVLLLFVFSHVQKKAQIQKETPIQS